MFWHVNGPHWYQNRIDSDFWFFVPNLNGNSVCPWFWGKFQSKNGFMAMAAKDLSDKKIKIPYSGPFVMSNSSIIAMCDIIRINGIGVISSKRSVKVAPWTRWTGTERKWRFRPRCCLILPQSGAGRLRYIDLLAWHKFFLGDTIILHRFIVAWGCRAGNRNF